MNVLPLVVSHCLDSTHPNRLETFGISMTFKDGGGGSFHFVRCAVERVEMKICCNSHSRLGFGCTNSPYVWQVHRLSWRNRHRCLYFTQKGHHFISFVFISTSVGIVYCCRKADFFFLATHKCAALQFDSDGVICTIGEKDNRWNCKHHSRHISLFETRVFSCFEIHFPFFTSRGRCCAAVCGWRSPPPLPRGFQKNK